MKSNLLTSRARLPGPYGWLGSLLLACCLISFPSACKAKPHHVDLTWDAPKSSPVPVVGYNIYRSPDGGSSYHRLNRSPIKETKYEDSVIQNGRTYRYLVRSVSVGGVESPASNTVDVTVPR